MAGDITLDAILAQGSPWVAGAIRRCRARAGTNAISRIAWTGRLSCAFLNAIQDEFLFGVDDIVCKPSIPQSGRPWDYCHWGSFIYEAPMRRSLTKADVPSIRQAAKYAFSGTPKLKVLAYHGVVEDNPGYYDVLASEFARQMTYLVSRSYRVLRLAQGLALLARHELPRRSVAITFDDANANVVSHALPILNQHGFACTVFAPTGLVGDAEHAGYHEGKLLMTWEQLRRVAADGHDLGGHSVTHADLTSLTPKQVIFEVRESYRHLADRVGQSDFYFAYPFGMSNEDVRRTLAKSQYRGAVGFGDSLSNSFWTDPYALKRSMVVRRTRLREFALLVNPAFDLMQAARARWRKSGV